ncbi:prolyl oligopeptidase family serine peptidase [Arenibacter sp. F20364]|uniref:carboxylesterase family protein n=1 Tax=Arenibacter sp. F20364 TaxID=2926415 RepID=UPI001FF5E1F1|nr:prolyl oligopeptidase family serine peptidase [Arenibacter sp. F20364]MCK0192593.1 prolyl oligopeptidase family serine peptidase [Arenibacter sp. F20364]
MEIKHNLIGLFFVLGSVVLHGQNDFYKSEMFTKDSDTLRYRIMYPPNYSIDEQYPIILFLHGAGERGSDNKKQLVHGSTLFSSEGNRDKFPAIVVFPQCPKEDYWSSVQVDRRTQPVGLSFEYDKGPTKALGLTMALMDSLVTKSHIKKDQVYVMGLSMGGMGTFEILYRKPEMFAAAIPICGGGDTNAAKAYAHKVPLWIFHGAQDNVVDPKLSMNMTSKIIEYGGHPNLTIFGGANHNSWDPAFAEPNLLHWLFSLKRSE